MEHHIFRRDIRKIEKEREYGIEENCQKEKNDMEDIWMAHTHTTSTALGYIFHSLTKSMMVCLTSADNGWWNWYI